MKDEMLNDGEFDEFEKRANRIMGLAIGWFCMVALMGMAAFCGFWYVVYLLLVHFGVIVTAT